ncbi:methylated-DNA--[protein]-cysteine S-methyltransferase [Paenibacillus sp. GD4]|uniref:methylated-DNA--[protein]-cysteine S-methyltransferase n=1 Tax=Paenibacillus sp. GD4 TaxID=3068890 RepID=UPI002796A480|nr:methylated-DNA--[protein]-cysteine S-methyltransferase [Paenibacillus sp. GD4]MDQ1910100.1 methylated-DNA--[protein]-cysteine S-methyltransferase [Paenibacillus sp. GD4]
MKNNRSCTEVYWDTLLHPLFDNRPIYLAATEKGLCRITWPTESFDTLQSWVLKQIPDALLIENGLPLAEAAEQLRHYFDGRRDAFSLPLDMRGTPFQIRVWQALKEIPLGQTRSYSDIAVAVGSPAAVRAVGAANGANPIPIVVPCHRVIGKNAALTGFRGGIMTKQKLLEREGFHDYTGKAHARFRF